MSDSERRQDVSVISWEFSRELLDQFLPRLAAAGILGSVIGFLFNLAGFTSMGVLEGTVAFAFWVAAALICSFRGHPGRMFFWMLTLDAGLMLYQISIINSAPSEDVFLKLGPALLAGLLFVVCSGGRARQSPFLYVAWFGLNLPAFVAGGVQGSLSPAEVFVVSAANLIYPLVYYYAIGCIRHISLPYQVIWDSISIGILILCVLPLLMIPVELSLRQTDSFGTLQFGGRAYSVIGLVLLAWPMALPTIMKWPPFFRWISLSIVLLLFASSFSRGGMIAMLLILVGSIALSGKMRGKLLSTLGGFVAAVGLTSIVLAPKWLLDAGWFWLLRLNVASNHTEAVSFDADAFLETSRLEIWQIALTLFERSPLWGHGIGSFPLLITQYTADTLSYSGAHNLMLTVLVERGILGFVGVALLLGRLIYLAIMNREFLTSRALVLYSFFVFALFANTTGVELFLNGSRMMNVTLTVYLFVVVGALEYWLELANQHQPSSTMSHAQGS